MRLSKNDIIYQFDKLLENSPFHSLFIEYFASIPCSLSLDFEQKAIIVSNEDLFFFVARFQVECIRHYYALDQFGYNLREIMIDDVI